MALQDASAVPTPGPDDRGHAGARRDGRRPATPAPSAAPTGGTGSTTTPLLIGAVVVIAVIVGGLLLMRRRGPKVEEE